MMRTYFLLVLVFLFSTAITKSQGVYTDVNPDIAEHYGILNFYFDIDKDGVNDINFHFEYYGLGLIVEIQPENSTYISIQEGSSAWVDTLSFGIEINEGLYWTNSVSNIRDFSGENQLWWGVDNKMIGVMKVDGPDNYFSWFRIGLSTTHTFTIYDYSFNPTPNEPIFAGNDAKYVASELTACDTANNLNGTDIYVSARHADYWDEIAEYRLIAVKSENAGLFDLEQANQLTDDRYLTIPYNSEISTTFLSNSKDSDGDLIGTTLSYNIFILSIINPGDTSVLSNHSNIVNIHIWPETVNQIEGTDISDYGDGRDLQIEFEPIVDETTISEYRIFVVPYNEADTFNLVIANNIPEYNFITVVPNETPILIQLTENSPDVNGEGISSGGYQIFVMSVANGVQTNGNALSEPSAIVGLRVMGESMILCGLASPDMQFIDIEPNEQIVVPPGNLEEISIDLDNNGINDLKFEVTFYIGTTFDFYTSKITIFDPTNVMINIGPLKALVPLFADSEDWISSSSEYLVSVGGYPCWGSWCGTQEPAYMGFKVYSETDTILCWLKVDVNPGEIVLYEYAIFQMNPSGISSNVDTFQISPNPTSGFVYINTDFPENIMSFCIYNLQGIKMDGIEFTSNLSPINITSLPNGIYLLRINFKNGQSAISKIAKR